MEYTYKTNYSLQTCLDYLSHQNILDTFDYQLEVIDGEYYITFLEYKSSTSFLHLANSPKPRFKLKFQQTNQEGTLIYMMFIEQPLQPFPFVSTKDIHNFWKHKLNAEPFNQI